MALPRRRFDHAGARVAGAEDVAARVHVDAHHLRVPVGLGVVLDPRGLACRRARLDDEAVVDARVLRAAARRVELVIGVGQLACVEDQVAQTSASSLRRPLPASDHTPGCPKLRPASANRLHGRLWPALSGLVATWARAWRGVRVEDGRDGAVGELGREVAGEVARDGEHLVRVRGRGWG